jgi:hypothetical protein
MTDALLNKIRDVKKQNHEIILRIAMQQVGVQKLASDSVHTIHPDRSGNCLQFLYVCKESPSSRDEVIASALSKAAAIEVVNDVFNDKLNYNMRAYEDLLRLNEMMLPVC